MPSAELQFLDEHALRIRAPRAAVWSALERHVERSLRTPAGTPLARLLGTGDADGFAQEAATPPERLVLGGRHRYAAYRLEFLLDSRGNDARSAGDVPTTVLRARSFAAFPGRAGRVYRALVVGTRAHVLATRLILLAVRREALRARWR